jgi:dTDP-alpha-D-glucuronic acid decarboxylase
VGANLVDRLLARGDTVIATDIVGEDDAMNLRDARNQPRYEYVRLDVRDLPQIMAFADRRIDLVYHLASVVGVRRYMEDPLMLIDVVVLGTRNVIRFCQTAGVRLVFTSTSEIYGRNPKVPWREDDDRVVGATTVDRWCYSSSKSVCEHMLFAMRSVAGFSFSIARFFNVYGPRQSPIYIVSQSIHRALQGAPPYVYDGGQQTRCFTYIDDAIGALEIIGEHDAALGEAFNIGFPREHTIAETVQTVLDLTDPGLGIEPVDTGRKYGAVYEDIDRRVPDVSKIRNLLGWEARIPLEEGVRRTVDWARRTPWWLEIRVDG